MNVSRRAMKPPRHFYEVITEGKKSPRVEICICIICCCKNILCTHCSIGTVCRLYFDIEYKLALNPRISAIPTLQTFIEVQ